MITQIYEIQQPREAEQMISLAVDHIGSVVTDSERWKQPGVRDTIRLVADSDSKSSLILLFEDVDIISAALDYYRPDIVHFCQSVLDRPDCWEPVCGKLVSMQATVRERFPEIAIMRSIPIPPTGSKADLPVIILARHFEPLSDFFLTDTLLVPAGEAGVEQPERGYVGITGKTCDWEIARQLVSESTIPVVLASGLSPENVHDGIMEVRPAGVDSCTLTNAVDERGTPIRFKKDTDKVAKFVAEAKRAAKEAGIIG